MDKQAVHLPIWIVVLADFKC